MTNLLRKSLSCRQGFKLVPQNSRLSSTKRSHGIFSTLGVTLNPILDFLFICVFRVTLVRTSIQMINKYGDKGSPLVDFPSWSKKLTHLIINNNRIWHCDYPFFDLSNPFFMKAQLLEGFEEKPSFHPIISFFHINCR